MAEYVKVLNRVTGEEWFQSLSCLERGFWFQGLILAKNAGDSGDFSCASASQLGKNMGCDGSTGRKILRKFISLGKWQVRNGDNNTITITIHKYMYWQELSSYKEHRKKEAAKDQKPPRNRLHIEPTNQPTNQRILEKVKDISQGIKEPGPVVKDERTREQILKDDPPREVLRDEKGEPIIPLRWADDGTLVLKRPTNVRPT